MRCPRCGDPDEDGPVCSCGYAPTDRPDPVAALAEALHDATCIHDNDYGEDCMHDARGILNRLPAGWTLTRGDRERCPVCGDTVVEAGDHADGGSTTGHSRTTQRERVLREALEQAEAREAAALHLVADDDACRSALRDVSRPGSHPRCWCPQAWYDHMKRTGIDRHSIVCDKARAALAEGD